MSADKIHIGIGGWTYPPWRGEFYPEDLPHDRELEFASRAVTAIEINATYYRLQSAASFARWAETVPERFVFSVKASRYCTNRKDLSDAQEAIEKFLAQGLTELGDKLGPILWQLMPTKRFDPDEIRAFLALLPPSRNSMPLRHALEVRHESFCTPEFITIAREHGVACVFTDSPEYPQIADCTADFVYARLQDAREEEPLGYDRASLDRLAKWVGEWAKGGEPRGVRYIDKVPRHAKAAPKKREVFAFVIDGAKVRAPAAAQALLERVTTPARRSKAA